MVQMENTISQLGLTVMIESSLTADSSCSSTQRTEASGAGFANPVVSSNIWSSLKGKTTSHIIFNKNYIVWNK